MTHADLEGLGWWTAAREAFSSGRVPDEDEISDAAYEVLEDRLGHEPTEQEMQTFTAGWRRKVQEMRGE